MVKSYASSLKGHRDQNEDTHVIIENMTTGTMRNDILNINFYSVFDGHGGKQVSHYLKETLPVFFTDKRVEYPLVKKYVVNVYDHIQTKLKNTKYANHVGSTALVVIHFKANSGEYLNIMNAGDCRCILCRDNFAIPLTKDHKPNLIEEYRRIEGLGGNILFDGDDWRIKGLSVSRAFGDIDATPYVTHRPDIFKYKIDKSDKFIVIGCDGLYDCLDNTDIVNFVLLNCYDVTITKRINQNINIAKRLGDYAISKGSTDNISVIVVFFD